MKRIKIISIALLVTTFFGCVDEPNVYYDRTPPAVPSNIRTYTGDNQVEIRWNPVYNSDLEGYAVYWSYSYNGKYELIGSTKNTFLIDYGAANGVTLYYAVASFDYDGNESELSYDVAYDTPRPEGFGNRIYDFWYYPYNSAYNFANYQVTAYNSDYADFFFENDNGAFYLNVWEDTDIQDMGWTYDIYDISEAPIDGWIELNPGANVKYVRAFIGHTYVIWTWDNHFAKIRIRNITDERMTYDWAYQVAEGNAELKTNRNSETRAKLPDKINK